MSVPPNPLQREQVVHSDEEAEKLDEIFCNKERLLKYYPESIEIKSIGFNFASGSKEILQSPELDKKTLKRILAGFLKISEEQKSTNNSPSRVKTEIREKYINLGSGNIETIEIRYTIREE